MQSELEAKAISKRIKDIKQNGEKLFGVNGNQVSGNNSDKEYPIDGSNSRKGGESQGSLVDHLHAFDFTTGGDVEDVKARNRQLSYEIPGINKYDLKNTYSDADAGICGDVDYSKIDTDLNIGQVVIY